jgi:pimeloyl-ACP methyl ester carboxylesterase
VDRAAVRGDDPRQCGILARLVWLGAAAGGALAGDPAGPAGLRRLAGARALWLERRRARGRYRHFLDALGIAKCHLVGAKYGGSACIAFASANAHRLHSLALFGSPVRGSGTGNADLIRQKGVRAWAAETMRARLGSAAPPAQVAWWADELMGRTSARAALAASSARIDMELEEKLPRIGVPVLIVTSQESGLQSVAAVKAYAARLPDCRVIVLPGDSYHVAAADPETCVRHAAEFFEVVAQSHATARERRGSIFPSPLEGEGQGGG